MIDFPNVDKNAKIVVAMSGGVDSSTCVALLQEAGYTNITGMTLLLYENDDEKGIICRDQTIIDDCNKVIEILKIPHVFIELKDKFMEEIINPFLNGYLNGITVNPCVTCNKDIKFGALLEEARKIGADYVVTGHYIKWQATKNGMGAIFRGNTSRDQSYFLSQVRPQTLKYMRFPLANFSKEETRGHAQRFGLHVANKLASRDLCFAGGSSYADIVKKVHKDAKSGNIVTKDGKILAKHDGIHSFTVGQRKGIGIGGQGDNPLFVIKLNPQTNEVVVGTKEDLATKEILLNDINWLGDGSFSFKEMKIQAKVRSSQALTEAILYTIDVNHARIVFEDYIYGVAKGQLCAFYDKDRLLGSGYI